MSMDVNADIKKAIEDSKIYSRPVGHWVPIGGYATPGGDPVWCCSECGKGVHVYGIETSTYLSERDVSDQQWVACPNCGALMIQE